MAEPDLERGGEGRGGDPGLKKNFFGNVVRFSEPIKLCTKLNCEPM